MERRRSARCGGRRGGEKWRTSGRRNFGGGVGKGRPPRRALACPRKYYVEPILVPCFHADTAGDPQGQPKSGRTMMSDRTNLAALGNEPTRRQLIAGVASAFGGLALGSTEAWAGTEEEISRTAESIHHEARLQASRKR